MSLDREPRYLLDVNVLLSLVARDHVHHQVVKAWFYAVSGRKWALCAFTEAGFLRNATVPRPGQIPLVEAASVLKQLSRHPGYHYLPIVDDWHTLCSPFFARLYGTKQVTDAYLLGLALRNNLILVTLDKGILHLAGEHRSHVHLLTEPKALSKAKHH